MAAVRASVPLMLPDANRWNSTALQNATWAAADLQLELAVTLARSDVNLLATQLIQNLNASPAGSTMGGVGVGSRTRTIIHFLGMLSSGRGTVLGYAMRIAAGVPTSMMRLKGMTAVMAVDMKLLQYRLSEFISGWPPNESSLFLARARALREEMRSGTMALVTPMTPAEFGAALNVSAPEYGASLVRDLILLTAELESLQASLLARVAARQSDAKASLLATISGALLALLAMGVAARAWCAIARTSRLRTIEDEALRRRHLTRTLMHEVRQPLNSLLVGMELLKGIAAAVFARTADPAATCSAPAAGASAAASSALPAVAGGTDAKLACSLTSPPHTHEAAPVSCPPASSNSAHSTTLRPTVTTADPSSLECAAEAAEIIDVMLEATLRLSRLTTDSLDLERMESATLPLAPVPSSLLSEVTHAVKEASFGAQPKRVRLLLDAQCDAAVLASLQLSSGAAASVDSVTARAEADLSMPPLSSDVTLLLDPDRLRQVLLNLMNNAVRHAPQGSDVRVALRVIAGGAAKVDVSRVDRPTCRSGKGRFNLLGCFRRANARVLPSSAAVTASSSQSAEVVDAAAPSDALPDAPSVLNVHSGASVASAAPVVVTISISDSGAGIPPAKQALLFQPFSQLHGSSRDGQGTAGSGLGLAVSRSLVQLMGGDISVASAPDHGTTFTVKFSTTTHASTSTTPHRFLCSDGASSLTTIATGSAAVAAPRTAVAVAVGSAPAVGPISSLDASAAASSLSSSSSSCSPSSSSRAPPAAPAASPSASPSSLALSISRPQASAAAATGSGIPASPPVLTPRTWSSTAAAPAAATAATTSVSSTPLAGLGLRLLVVDDTDSNLRLLVKLAQSLGAAAVDGVGDGAAALELVRAKAAAGMPYHAILLDRHMPIMDGETCARTLRGPAVGYTGVILAVSADADRSFLDAGADALVQKPVSRAALSSALCRRLGI